MLSKDRISIQNSKESTIMKLRTKIALGAATVALSITAALAFNAAGISSSLDFSANYDCGSSQPCQLDFWQDAYGDWYPYYQQYLGEYWWYYGMGLCEYWEYQETCAAYEDDVNQLSMVVSHINMRIAQWD